MNSAAVGRERPVAARERPAAAARERPAAAEHARAAAGPAASAAAVPARPDARHSAVAAAASRPGVFVPLQRSRRGRATTGRRHHAALFVPFRRRHFRRRRSDRWRRAVLLDRRRTLGRRASRSRLGLNLRLRLRRDGALRGARRMTAELAVFALAERFRRGRSHVGAIAVVVRWMVTGATRRISPLLCRSSRRMVTAPCTPVVAPKTRGRTL